MANQTTQAQAAQVYGAITRQIGGQTRGGAKLATFANVPGNRSSSSYYQSRVGQSKQNGAGPTSDPINAPWSFTDFVYGQHSLKTGSGSISTCSTGSSWLPCNPLGWLGVGLFVVGLFMRGWFSWVLYFLGAYLWWEN